MLDSIPLFPKLPGGPKLLIALLIIVLLFGANKLPQLARLSGQAMGEFRRGREEIEEKLKKGTEGGSDEGENRGEAEADGADTTETEAEGR